MHLLRQVTLRPHYHHVMSDPATTSSTRCCHSSAMVSPITYSSSAPYWARSSFRIWLNALHIECQNYYNEEDPRDDDTPRCFRRRWSCFVSDKFKACIDQIPIFFTAIGFSVNRTLNCWGSEEDTAGKNKTTPTMSATRAQSWIVVRQGVEWTITCARENILVFDFILSLI